MRVFERIRDWWRGVPSEVTYDELVTAYEWATFGGRFSEPLSLCTIIGADIDLLVPITVVATLRKLGAA